MVISMTAKPPHPTFVLLLAMAKTRRGWSRAELTKALHYDRGVLGNWRTRGVPPKELPFLAETIGHGTTVDELSGKSKATSSHENSPIVLLVTHWHLDQWSEEQRNALTPLMQVINEAVRKLDIQSKSKSFRKR